MSACWRDNVSSARVLLLAVATADRALNPGILDTLVISLPARVAENETPVVENARRSSVIRFKTVHTSMNVALKGYNVRNFLKKKIAYPTYSTVEYFRPTGAKRISIAHKRFEDTITLTLRLETSNTEISVYAPKVDKTVSANEAHHSLSATLRIMTNTGDSFVEYSEENDRIEAARHELEDCRFNISPVTC